MNIQDWIIVHNGEMEKQYKAQKQLKLYTTIHYLYMKTKESSVTTNS